MTHSIQTITGPGTASDVPDLPAGLRSTLQSRLIDIGSVRLHAVTGGSGPALLLLSGWPQTWYVWRHLLGALTERFTVVALEARGVGRSEMPEGDYDAATLANDAVAAMSRLGHARFDVIGHDIGMWIGYAIAADHPEIVDRLVVAEAAIPGITRTAPVLGTSAINDKLWHFAFNRLDGLNETLVRGNEHAFFSHQFRSKAASPTALPDAAVDEYVAAIARHPAGLRASFAPYRALDETMQQNEVRRQRRLTLPVLAIGGEMGLRSGPAVTMRSVADDVTELITPDAGHYPMEENPAAVAAAIGTFFSRGDSRPNATLQ